MSTSLFLTLFLAFFFLEFIINWLLDILNQKEIAANPQVPGFFKDTISETEYQKSREYTLTNISFSKWERMLASFFTLTLLFSGLLPLLNKFLTGLELNKSLSGVLFFFSIFGLLIIARIIFN